MQTKKSALSFCIFSLPCFIAYVLSEAPHLPHARPQQNANDLHRLAAHCHARRFTQSNLRALQPPMSETTPGTETPHPPFRRTSPMCRRKGRLGSVKRGIRNHIGVLSPFCLRRQTAEGLPSAEGKEEKEAGTHSHFPQTSGQYPTVACLPFRTTGVFISVPSSSSFSFLSSS